VITPDVLLLSAFAFLAGFVDAVVGGGGLVQIPALMILMPQTPVAVLFGTNKAASVWGTAAAAWQYLRHIQLPWRGVIPAALAALLFSYAGAAIVSMLDPNLLRPLVLGLLIIVLIYTLIRKDFGALHAPRLGHTAQLVCGALIGAVIGFYDGFFGPGTGSFLVLAFVGVFGFSFLHASAAAKIVNVITNVAALSFFIFHDQVRWHIAIPMAVCNLAGGLAGSRLAIARGSRFVRIFFVLVVLALTIKLSVDMLG